MGLGRGLSAILPDVEEVVESVDQASEGAAPVPADAVAEIPVGEIDPNRNQPRKRFDDDALLALADSIRHNGVLLPILVAREGGRYTIIAGERRWRAARLANLSTIPAIVREGRDQAAGGRAGGEHPARGSQRHRGSAGREPPDERMCP